MKKNLLYIAISLLSLFLIRCVDNDLPYPYIVGQILDIKVEGQTQDPEIDLKNKKITLVVSEGVDIKNLIIRQMKVNEGTPTVIIPESDNFIDKNLFPRTSFSDTLDNFSSFKTKVNFSKSAKFNIYTYQDHIWYVDVLQPVERYVKSPKQVGSAIIDEQNRIVILKVDKTTDMSNVEISDMKLGLEGSTISPDFKTIKDFSDPQPKSFIVTDKWGNSQTWQLTIEYSNVRVITHPANPWAKKAYLSAGKSNDVENPNFEYRTLSSQTWIRLDKEQLKVESESFSAEVRELLPSTNYVYRALDGDEAGEEQFFTTEEAYALPNSDFSQWSAKKIGNNKNETHYPNADAANSFWATGNEGVNMSLAGNKPSNSTWAQEIDGVKKGARLESVAVSAVNFAAGSLVLGQYKTNASLDPINARKSMKPGREIKARPTKLKGKYKYFPLPIDVRHKDFEKIARDGDGMQGDVLAEFIKQGQKGEMDKCHIYIKLEDKTNGANILIAYAELKSDQKVDEYTPFEIVLDYKFIDKKPTHMSIVCSSSYLGDYFTGALGSTLYVQDLELVYD